jgi:hypothetical protein
MGIDKGILAAFADHKEKIKGPHFIFSADRPVHPQHKEIDMNHDQILNHLFRSGYDAHEIKGHFGQPSRCIIIYRVSPEVAEELHQLAAKIGQGNSIYSNGLASEMRFHHGAYANRAHYANDTDYYDDAPQDGYYSLPGDSHHFSHRFNYKSIDLAGQLAQRSESGKRQW